MRMLSRFHRPLCGLSLAFAILLLGACAAPTPSANAPGAAVASSTPSDDGEYPRPKPPLPSRDPMPGAVVLDHSCRTNADCAVKNVGSCCGYSPACVNVNSPTDPKGVQAECAKKGMMSVCGFKDISACSCNAGHCEAASSGLVQ